MQIALTAAYQSIRRTSVFIGCHISYVGEDNAKRNREYARYGYQGKIPPAQEMRKLTFRETFFSGDYNLKRHLQNNVSTLPTWNLPWTELHQRYWHTCEEDRQQQKWLPAPYV